MNGIGLPTESGGAADGSAPLGLWAARELVWIGLVVAMMAIQIKWWWEPGPDAGAYLSIGRHFAHGQIARFGEGHLHYAPGYPLLIAPLYWLGDRPFLAISIGHFLLMMVFAAGIANWLRPICGRAQWMVTALVMANCSLWYTQRQTLSEAAFLPLLVWGAVALREMGASQTARRRVLWGLLAVVLVTLAGITRQTGVLLLGGYACVVLWQARQERSWPTLWRGLAGCVAVAIPVAIVVGLVILDDHTRGRRAGHAGYVDYMSTQGMSWPVRIAEGVRLRVGEIGRLTVPGMMRNYARFGDWWHFNNFLYAAIAIVIAAGWWRVVRRRPDPLLWTLPIYWMFYVFWPFDQATRYLLPMLPVLVAAVWGLIERLRFRYVIGAALLAAHLVVSLGDWGLSLRWAEVNRRAWPRVEALGEPVLATGEQGGGVGGGAVGSIRALPGVDDATVMMYQQVINRKVARSSSHGNPEAKILWLIAPAGRPNPPGFSVTKTAGSLVLLRRSASRDER